MSDSFIELLILSVRNTKILWDMTDKRYHNRLLVDREWARIGKELGQTKETVKGKWRNLRDTFKRELKKITKPKSGDGAEQASQYTRLWCHFDEMLFLKSIVSPRKMEGNLSAPQNTIVEHAIQEEETGSDVEENEDIVELSTPSEQFLQTSGGDSQTKRLRKELEDLENLLPAANSSTNPIEVPVRRKRKGKVLQNQESNFEQQILQLEAKKLDLLKADNDDDDDINFFKSLLPYVKQLPSLNKLNYRVQVQNLLIQELTKLQAPIYVNCESKSSTTVSSPFASPNSSTFVYNNSQQPGPQHQDQHNYSTH